MYYVSTFLYNSGAGTFTPEDAFVGYQSDTPASIVFKVWQDLQLSNVDISNDDDQWEEEVYMHTHTSVTM